MVERRWGKRFRSEITARFGEKDLDQFGLVQDISIFGFFIVTPKSYPTGTPLKIRITTMDHKIADLQGVVKWGKESEQTSVWVIQDGGLGIEIKTFLNGQENYEELCQKLCKSCAGGKKCANPVCPPQPSKKKFNLFSKFFRE